ncbi:hypothetical protein ROZALSC1DRAFT_23744 [Rozella allomycis CSF55]|uniref:Integrase zinc-binding domain-containing protein n=1 Tax=Rozella allomycis (strain CSF55) TaxID=988480 RepID=A0A4P9YGW7_ROZAC|nr:hypothetical protein ROZALSC1DRAFT_23744 [Rozella allomycis CSF55]
MVFLQAYNNVIDFQTNTLKCVGRENHIYSSPRMNSIDKQYNTSNIDVDPDELRVSKANIFPSHNEPYWNSDIKNLLQNYPSIQGSETHIALLKNAEYRIQLLPQATLRYQRAYQIPFAIMPQLKQEISKKESMGIIKKATDFLSRKYEDYTINAVSLQDGDYPLDPNIIKEFQDELTLPPGFTTQVITYKNLNVPYIPTLLRKPIIEWMHFSLQHAGITKVYETIRKIAYWPHLQEHFVHFSIHATLPNFEAVKIIWKNSYGEKKNTHVISMIDWCTRMVELVAVDNIQAATGHKYLTKNGYVVTQDQSLPAISWALKTLYHRVLGLSPAKLAFGCNMLQSRLKYNTKELLETATGRKEKENAKALAKENKSRINFNYTPDSTEIYRTLLDSSSKCKRYMCFGSTFYARDNQHSQIAD